MSEESRALKIAKSAIVKVFKNGGETTVTLPKFWSMQISVARTLRDTTELEVMLVSMLKDVKESIFFKRLSVVLLDAFEPYFASAIIYERGVLSLIVHGRFKLSVMYLTGNEEVVTANITVRKV